MAEEKIKLPRSSFEELCKIITAYGHQKEPVAPKDVATTAALGEDVVSANNKFLLGVGIIEGGRKKSVSSIGRKLAQALDLNMPNEIRAHWREIIRSSDFLSRILAAVRIRKGMDEATLQAHIAYSAGEPNKGFVMTGARAVINMLRAAELIREDEGKLIAVDVQTCEAVPDGPEIPTTESVIHTASIGGIPLTQASVNLPVTVPGLNLSISVNIDCKPADLEGLGNKIRQVIEELSSKKADNDLELTDEQNLTSEIVVGTDAHASNQGQD